MPRKTDERIRHEILEELGWDTRIGGSIIDVAVAGGVVTLTGTAGSYAEKLAAQGAAQHVLGVTDIANELAVTPSEQHARNDTEIARAVRHALVWDAMVPDDRIQSAVSDGWVTLAGTVDRWSEREDAEATVRRLVGVRGITNLIAVAPLTSASPNMPSIDVRRMIDDVLARRAHREAHGIRAQLHDGVIALEGDVRSWAEKEAILGAIRDAPGIRGVTDHLRIDPHH
jgi:osmotically-inducible protein OsmY